MMIVGAPLHLYSQEGRELSKTNVLIPTQHTIIEMLQLQLVNNDASLQQPDQYKYPLLCAHRRLWMGQLKPVEAKLSTHPLG